MGFEQELADFNGKFEASAPPGAAAFLNSKIGKLMIGFRSIAFSSPVIWPLNSACRVERARRSPCLRHWPTVRLF